MKTGAGRAGNEATVVAYYVSMDLTFLITIIF